MFWGRFQGTRSCVKGQVITGTTNTSHSVSVSVSKCWTLALLSAEVVAKRQPSGEMWQERMAPWWASISCSFSPLSVSHILGQATRTQRSLRIWFEDAVKTQWEMCEFYLDGAIKWPREQSCVRRWAGEQQKASDLFPVTLQCFTLPRPPPPNLQEAMREGIQRRNQSNFHTH